MFHTHISLYVARKHTAKMGLPIPRSKLTSTSNGRLSSPPESKPKRRKLQSLDFSEKKAEQNTRSKESEATDFIRNASKVQSSNEESDEAIMVEDSKSVVKDAVKSVGSKESSSEQTVPSMEVDSANTQVTDTAAEITPNMENTSRNKTTNEKQAIHPFFCELHRHTQLVTC